MYLHYYINKLLLSILEAYNLNFCVYKNLRNIVIFEQMDIIVNLTETGNKVPTSKIPENGKTFNQGVPTISCRI